MGGTGNNNPDDGFEEKREVPPGQREPVDNGELSRHALNEAELDSVAGGGLPCKPEEGKDRDKDIRPIL